MIHCFNPNCQAANADTETLCQSCQWPLVRRFLWAVGTGVAGLTPGTLVAGRYQVVAPRWVLDTQPARSPVPLDLVPPAAQPYLGLIAQGITIPRPFTEITTDKGLVLLLETVALSPAAPGQPPRPLPTLIEAWPQASPCQQIAWLWHLARLWEPLERELATETLLQPDLVRVDGATVHLQELVVVDADTALDAPGDGAKSDSLPSLADLGKQWHGWVKTAHPSLRPYLDVLSRRLSAGDLTPAQLKGNLIQAVERLTASAQRQVALVAYSDQGPTRQRNEDACYPATGTAMAATVASGEISERTAAPLLLVCDGIGGHQGGDVASRLTIEAVLNLLTPLLKTPDLPHSTLVTALEDAVLQANHAIAEQNDQDQRQARDRMGTTLVIAVVYGARLYITHLGDSRAYKVRPHGCYQITLDDDVATREVRMGYSLYRDALLSPGAGSLVQAIGMADSKYLHPAVQMHILAEDSLWLICSDGLSDHDLIERLWEPELLPILQGQQSIEAGGQQLITLANTFNGHDNVTVGLLRIQVPPQESLPLLGSALGVAQGAPAPARTSLATTTTAKTAAPRSPRGGKRWLLPLGGILGGVLVGMALAFWGSHRDRANQVNQADPAPREGQSLAPNVPPPSRPAALSVGDRLRVQSPSSGAAVPPLTLTAEIPAAPGAPAPGASILPEGTVVQVLTRRAATATDNNPTDNQLWVELRVCTVPDTPEAATPATPPPATSQPGDQGWILEATVLPVMAKLESETDSPCP